RRRVGGVDDRGRRLLDVGLDGRLLTALGRAPGLVGSRHLNGSRRNCLRLRRPLDVVLAAARTAAARAATAHGAEIGPVAASLPARLARGAEPFRDAGAPATGLILLAEPRVLVGDHAAVALGHDLALV